MDIRLSSTDFRTSTMLAKVTCLLALVAFARSGVVPAAYGLGYAAAPVAAVAATPVYRQAPALSYAAPAVVAHAAPVLATPVVAKAVVAAAAQPYEFGYTHQLEDGTLANRQEVSDANNNRQGSYGYTGPDGIYRQVDYVADALGFRATIRTNEPGTAPQNPAATQVLAQEPPYKVLPAAAPIVKAVATPVLAKTVVSHAAPVYAAAAAPVYAHAAAPVYAHAAAPVYAHAAVPAVVKAAVPAVYGASYLH